MKQFGEMAAIVIQCVYRGYMVRGSHKPALYQRRKVVRSAKVLVLQCLFRRYLGRKRALLKRKAFTAAAISVQKIIRGFFGRKFVRRHKAALVLQNSAKTFKDRRFFNMVMMVVQLRGVLRRRTDACTLIQKVARGYMVRASMYAKRLSSLDRYHRAAAFITKLYGAFQSKKARHQKQLKLLQRNKLLCRLAQMIEELYFQRRDHRELAVAMSRSAPVMQALVRGFIAQSRVRRMKFLRKAMVTWCDPRCAQAFLSDFLTKMIPVSLSASAVGSAGSQSSLVKVGRSGGDVGGSGAREKEVYLSAHVPLKRRRRQDYVDLPLLAVALQGWYRQCGKPLLQAEITSIYARFRNPNNSKVYVPDIDDYISWHVEPCRKHARTICGDCVYFRECHFGACECKEFKKDKVTGLVCLHCSHPVSHHKLLPKGLNSSSKRENASLLALLNTVLQPDLSLPATVRGVEVDVVADQITRRHRQEARAEQQLLLTNTGTSSGTDTGALAYTGTSTSTGAANTRTHTDPFAKADAMFGDNGKLGATRSSASSRVNPVAAASSTICAAISALEVVIEQLLCICKALSQSLTHRDHRCACVRFWTLRRATRRSTGGRATRT